MSAKKKTAKNRYCLRCGCTQDRACPGGCSWVQNADVCTSCLTPGEHLVLLELVKGYNFGKGRERERILKRLNTFGKYLQETSMDLPIPFVVTEKGKEFLRRAKVGDKTKGPLRSERPCKT